MMIKSLFHGIKCLWCEALSVSEKIDVQLSQKFTVTQSTSEQLLGYQACSPAAAPKIYQS